MQTLIHDGVRVTLDVAHNPDGMKVLADTLSDRRMVYPMAVFGIVRDKNAGAVLDELRRVAREVITVAPATERALGSSEIARIATERGIPARDGGSVCVSAILPCGGGSSWQDHTIWWVRRSNSSRRRKGTKNLDICTEIIYTYYTITYRDTARSSHLFYR
jgi:hypothetical protein